VFFFFFFRWNLFLHATVETLKLTRQRAITQTRTHRAIAATKHRLTIGSRNTEKDTIPKRGKQKTFSNDNVVRQPVEKTGRSVSAAKML